MLFVHSPSDALRQLIFSVPGGVRVRTGAPFSETDFNRMQIAAQAALVRAGRAQDVSSSLSYESGVPLITFQSSQSPAVARTWLAPTIEAELARQGARPEFRFVAGAAVMHNTTSVHGGDWIGVCTAGFTVTSGSVQGISTAGHCSNSVVSYLGNPITFMAEADPATYGDLQWHRFNGAVTLSNQIRISTSSV